MDIEAFLAIVCFGIAVIFQIGTKWCSENVYIKGKYDRGRYLTIKKQKAGK